MDVVDLYPPTLVYELDEAQVLLLHRLVHLLVLSNPVFEVLERATLVRLGAVILVVHLRLPDVAIDDGLVRAHALDEEQLERQAVELLANPLSSRAGGVCRVENRHSPAVRASLLEVARVVFLEQKVDHVF